MFDADNKLAEPFEAYVEHAMLDQIKLARRLAYRLLRKRLKIARHTNNTISRRNEHDSDINMSISLQAGLEDSPNLNEMKMMGAIVNPLMQCDEHMISAGLCTRSEFDHGKEELVSRMTQFYERSVSGENEGDDEEAGESNQWSKFLQKKSGQSPRQMAVAEFNAFEEMCDAKFLPKMEPFRVLGAIDEEGQPKKPVYAFGKVKKRGSKIENSGGRNHADYVDETGMYDIVRFFDDFKEDLKSMYNVVTGQLCPHINAEVDCESLFSQAGILAHPMRARTGIRMYERLVVGKHRLHRIYCHIPRVQALYLRRWKSNDWDEDDNRDDQEFLKVERQIYLQSMPENAELFEAEEKEEEKMEAEMAAAMQKKNKDAKKKSGKKEAKKSGNKKQSTTDNNDVEVIDDSDAESKGEESV